MKQFFVLTVVSALLIACGTQSRVAQLEKAVEKTAYLKKEVQLPDASPVVIAADVAYLASDELQGRDTGSSGIEKAAAYIQERFMALGISPFQGDYMDRFQVKDKEAFNVVAQLPGSDGKLKDEIVVIGAHYDHIGFMKTVANDSIANGANDNATGTATVLAIAEALKKVDFNRRKVVFALFSAEEIGLLGSKHLAHKMKENGENVVAVINFEMTGVPMQNRPFLTYLTGYDRSNMGTLFNEANEELVVTGKLDKAAEFNLFQRSDNYPFYNTFNVPAHTFCTFDFTNFDHYHKVSDHADVIDSGHMARVVDAIMPGVLEIVNGNSLKLVSNE